MERLRIIFFSATGNTRRAVDIVRESCALSGIETELHELRDLVPGGLPPPGPGTETLIAFPALGFGAPHLALKRARSLPAGQGAAARVLAVCGAEARAGRIVPGWPGSGLEQVEGILRRKGYDVASTAFISYPANWTQMTEPASGAERDRLIAAGDAEARSFAAAVVSGEGRPFRCGSGHRLWTAVVNFLFRTAGRRFLGKIYAADSSCTSCGACAKACPVGAIVMRDGKPTWKMSCEDCNRCINTCPAAAIQVSTFKAALYLGLSIAYIPASIAVGRLALGALFPELAGFPAAAAVFSFVLALSLPAMALVLGPIDALVGLASRIRPIGRLVALGYTSRFGRYRAPGYAPTIKP